MDGDDYFVVMVYINQYCLDIFASLDQDANPHMFINLRWLITCLKMLDIFACLDQDANLHMFKAIACLVVVF
jgi:hypothetical protein